MKSYWDKRAIVHDMDAVGHIGLDQEVNEIIFGNFASVLRRACNGDKLGSIIDLGCGVGRWGTVLAKLGVYTTCVDFSSEMLNRNPSSDEVKVLADIASLPFEDDEYDTAFCCTVLQHVIDDELCIEAIREAQRVAKKFILIEAMCNWEGMEHIVYRPVSWYMKQLGTGVEKVRRAVYPHYLVWWSK